MFFSLAYLLLALVIAWRRSRCYDRSFIDLCVVYLPTALWLLPAVFLMATNPAPLAWSCNLLTITAVVALDWRSGRTRPRFAARGLRVVSYNLFGGSLNLEEALSFLRETDPDVVLLQEAWWSPVRRRRETVEVIKASFADWHCVRSEDPYEMMILSRWPLSEVEERDVGGRQLMRCVTETPAGRVRLFNVHLSPPAARPMWKLGARAFVSKTLDIARRRCAQAEVVAALVRESPEPTVLCGDFNSPAHAYPRRVQCLNDAFDQAGRGFGYSFPARFPLWRIDHVLVSAAIKVARCSVPAVHGSDHRPVVADLWLPRG